MSRYDRYTEEAQDLLRAAATLARARGSESCSADDLAKSLFMRWPACMDAALGTGAPERAEADRAAAVPTDAKLPITDDLRAVLDKAEALAPTGSIEPRHLVAGGWAELRAPLSVLLARELPTEPGSMGTSGDPSAGGAGNAADTIQLTQEELEFLLSFGRELGTDQNGVDVIGRDEEIETITAILLKIFKPNPMLLGEPGVGKTTIVEGFARRVREGRVPDRLKGKRVFEIRIGDLNAGTQFKGSFEERIKRLVGIVERVRDIIVFIDEIHLIGDEKFSQQLGNLLKPSLARGSFPCIGATTPEDYFRYLNRDEALTRRFQTVRVREPTKEETALILESLRLREEKHHGIAVDPTLVPEIVALSDAFIRGRFFPDKSIDLFDRACALAAVRGQKTLPRALVFEALSDIVGSPVADGASSLEEAYARLESVIRERVKGQDKAIDTVCAVIRLCKRRLDLRTERPDGVFLFVGPSGCGKTVLAETLAKAVSGGGNAFYRIDFSEYSEEISVSRLLGSSPGYVGYDDMPALAEAEERAGGGVILIDEFEKGHPRARKLFLQIFDTGRATLANGKKLDFSRATFVAATNAGCMNRKTIGFSSGLAEESPDAPPEAPLDALRAEFGSELLNRFDEIVPFRSLSRDDCASILWNVIFPESRDRLKAEYGAELALYQDSLAFIVERGYSPEFGARNLHRAFQELVLLPVTERSGDIKKKRIDVTVKNGAIDIAVKG